MSREVALNTINLKSTDRIAHTDYSLEYHVDYTIKKTGLSLDNPDTLRCYYDACHMDFLFGTNDGLHGNWAQFGRSTDMGHASYAADGSDMSTAKPSPFKTAEEVWAFDAVKEYGLPDGLIFEPCNDFGYMADHFGSSTVLIGSYVDCRDMTFNKWDKVKHDMDRTFEAAKRCKGLIFAVGNHLPANISDVMLDLYLNYLVDHWKRVEQ
jgi:hypothetical protein